MSSKFDREIIIHKKLTEDLRGRARQIIGIRFETTVRDDNDFISVFGSTDFIGDCERDARSSVDCLADENLKSAKFSKIEKAITRHERAIEKMSVKNLEISRQAAVHFGNSRARATSRHVAASLNAQRIDQLREKVNRLQREINLRSDTIRTE